MRFVFLGLLFLSACLFERVPSKHQFTRDSLKESDAQLAESLRRHVEVLAVDIGQRSYQAPEGLAKSADYIARQLRQYEQAPTATVRLATYRLTELPDDRLHRCTEYTCLAPGQSTGETVAIQDIPFVNIDLEVRGATKPEEIIVVGAHYDSDTCESGGCNPGADDNASGVAAMLELAARLHDARLDRTVRFVAFTNEEEPFFHTDAMGSLVYARAMKEKGENAVAMLSLETLGYYTDEPDSQEVPMFMDTLFDMPTVGNFLTFVGIWDSEHLIRDSVAAFQDSVAFPVEGAITYGWVEGIDWSDHWSFNEIGVPAAMVTDTAPNRNHCYHKPCDTADTLDYERMAVVVRGLEGVIRHLANR
jgi:hypothetical protein